MRELTWVVMVLALLGCDGEGGADGGALDAGPATDAGPRPDAAVLDGAVPDAGPPEDAGPGAAVGVMARRPDGTYPAPESTFTLPEVDDGMGMYIPDVQDRFSDVDWETLDRLYIPAGHYPFINLGNLPDRDPDAPLIITNLGGQVRVGALDHHYLFILGGGSGWVLSGRYDPIAQTGDAAFPGHRDNAYANTAGTYGFLVDDELVRGSVSGLAVGGGATQFEIEFVEITRVGFAGMLVKTDDQGGATMRDVRVHDTYVHDTVSEGMYFGSTQTPPQHTLEGWDVSYNRVLRAGTESIQLGQLAGANEVHHNVFGPSAVDWRDAFQPFQDGNLQISIRSGVTTVHHNVFLGAAGSMVGIFGNDVSGDAHADGDGVELHDNYFAHYRNLGVFADARGVAPLTVTIRDSVFRGYAFDRDEVYPSATPPGHVIRRNGETPLVVADVTYDDADRLCNAVAAECNGDAASFEGTGNAMGDVPAIAFVDAGLPAGFDYLTLEQWTDTASRNGDAPVSYPRGTTVTHVGAPYVCDAETCGPTDVPGESSSWTAREPFSDDVRPDPDGPYADLGLGEG